MRRQAERREDPLGLQEERHPADLAARHLVHLQRPRGVPAGRIRLVLRPGLDAVDLAGPRIESRQALGDGSCIQRVMFFAPLTHMAYGGIVISASSCSSVTSWSMSYRWNASTYLASSSDWSASTDAGRCSSGSAASVARARCSALFTAATLVPRVFAASAAGIFSTSHMIRVARCRAGR